MAGDVDLGASVVFACPMTKHRESEERKLMELDEKAYRKRDILTPSKTAHRDAGITQNLMTRRLPIGL